MSRLTSDQLKELGQFDGPTICNAIESFNLRPRTAGFTLPGMMQRTPQEKPMIGYAATVKVSAMHPSADANEKLLGYYATVREMSDPTIAVVQDIDAVPVGSFWGEVQATTHKALGGIGTITSGGVRDIKEVSDLGFYFFSTHLLISHGYIHVVDYNCTVDVCGLSVNPGDLLFADCYGVVQIPHEIAPQLANACRHAAEAELPMLEPCREAIKNGIKPSIEELREMRVAMLQKRQGK